MAARPVGYVLVGLSLAMVICAALGGLVAAAGSPNPELEAGAPVAMTASALVTAVVGVGLWAWSRGSEAGFFGRRHAALAVGAIWVGSGVFGGLPFVLDAGIAPVDAFFEAVSGFTTTGATIITDIQGTCSRSLLLWRSLIQWLGGMGIVVLFVAVFPNIGVGAKHLFRSEVPGPTSEGLQPRIAETSLLLWRLYLALTATLALLLWLLGMEGFEAICHAFTTMATGGFSTRDASIAHWDSPAIEMVITLFMLLAGANFGVYFAALRHRSLALLFRADEIRLYVLVVALSTAVLTLSTRAVHGGDLLQAFRYSFFQVATFMTTTGYLTDDYARYPSQALGVLVLVMFFGGCASSTAGGMKIARVAVLAASAWTHVKRSLRPTVVQVVRMDGKAVPLEVLNEVGAFFVIFLATLALCTLFVAGLDGVPLYTAFVASLSCVSNVGPAPFYLTADNFAGYSDGAKLVFALGMILGRLEFFTLLTLLLPDFWRR